MRLVARVLPMQYAVSEQELYCYMVRRCCLQERFVGPAQRREAALEAALAEAQEGAARAVAERDERLRALGEELAGANRWGRRGGRRIRKDVGRLRCARMHACSAVR